MKKLTFALAFLFLTMIASSGLTAQSAEKTCDPDDCPLICKIICNAVCNDAAAASTSKEITKPAELVNQRPQVVRASMEVVQVMATEASTATKNCIPQNCGTKDSAVKNCVPKSCQPKNSKAVQRGKL